MIGDATFSPCGLYRYTLTRRWLLGEGTMLWILLNPSTATAEDDDPTIRRCIGFAQDWGYQGMTLVNLFALRSTDPKGLLDVDDPIGPDNDAAIVDAVSEHEFVCAGWGIHGQMMDRSTTVLDLIAMKATVYCLGRTSIGEPRHPLYISKIAKPLVLKEQVQR